MTQFSYYISEELVALDPQLEDREDIDFLSREDRIAVVTKKAVILSKLIRDQGYQGDVEFRRFLSG